VSAAPTRLDAAPQAGSAPRRVRALCVALALLTALAFVAIRLPYLSIPLERDEGEYAYIAQRMLAGEMPYRDAFDQKPPGIFAAYLLAFAIGDRSAEAIHLFAALWTAATLLALYAVLRRLAGALAAGFGALAFAVASADPRVLATAANTELFALLPLVGSTYCLVRALARDRAGWWVACGALTALACTFKQVAATQGLFVLGVAASDALARAPGLWRTLARRFGWVALGVALVASPLLAGFAWAGLWSPFFDAVVAYNLRYVGALDWVAGVRNLAAAVATQAPSFAVAWGLAVVGALLPGVASGRARGLLAAWWLASFAGAAFGLYFRPHYFVQLLPALAGLVGIALASGIARSLAGPRASRAWLAAAAAAALILLPPLLANRGYRTANSPVALARALYGYNPFPEAPRIGAYLRDTSGPDDTIFVLGSEPEILFYAERRSATRYIFVYPLTAGSPDAAERQREAIREVRARRPRYVVWVQLDASLLRRSHTDPFLFRETAALVRGEYRIELIAIPAAEDALFEFVYGEAAARVLGERMDDPSAPAWVAVFRRAS
jgi:hypothetical protein